MVKRNRCQVIAIISLFDGGRHLLVPTSRRLGARAERRSRVAIGHRAATQPLTVASPAPGLRSGPEDVGGGMRTTCMGHGQEESLSGHCDPLLVRRGPTSSGPDLKTAGRPGGA